MTSHELREQSLAIATKFASTFSQDMSDYQRRLQPFRLARKLRVLRSEAVDHEDAVRALCDSVRENPDDFWERFLGAWDEVKFPDYERNGLEWAFEMAHVDPIPIEPKPASKIRQVVYSMCWHLGVQNHPHPFLLARQPLSALLGIHKASVSPIVKWLVKSRYIEAVGTYIPKRQAQRYRLLL
jgi:hypothetical protein